MNTVYLLLLVHTGLIILVDESQAAFQGEVSKDVETKRIRIPSRICPARRDIQDRFCPCYCRECRCNPNTEKCNYHTLRCDPINPITTTTPPPPCPCQSNKLIVENNSFPRPTAAACATDCANDPACKFWTFRPTPGSRTGSCALRYFHPTVRAYSLGNLSGKRGEPLSQWSLVENSVWVARKYKTHSCEQCRNLCKNNSQCKSVIFNRAFEECSFNYGDNSLTAIPLPPIYNFLGIASAFNSIARPNC